MAYLLPQFKCPPDILSIHFTAHPHHTHQLKTRQPICFRPQCVLTTTSAMATTTIVDIEKLHLPSLESHSNSVTADRSLTYIGSIDQISKASFRTSLATETITSEEAMIAAAAAEAVALAKAALQGAKDAASMGGYYPSANLAEVDNVRFDISTEMERTIDHHLPEAETIFEGEHSIGSSIKDDDYLDPTNDELKLLQMQLSESIAVRSGRQAERKVKRAKAAEKSASSVISVNSGSYKRKKRAPVREVDYSDPLHYLRATTSGSKLLTAAQELEFSQGIQVLLKLEKIHDELAERYGGEPTFAQWATAAEIDQKTLRKHLNHGTFCKEKMIRSNIRLVISIARKYQGAGMNIQDLVQEGCRGLVKGAEKFDATRGFKFSTYAHWWIKQTVRKSLSEQTRIIRLPFHMVEATYRVKEARKNLYNENGRYPNNKEIADATGLTMKRLEAVLRVPKPPRSLDQKIGIDNNLKPTDVISHPDEVSSEQLLIKQFMKQDLDKVLNSLTPKEKQVIKWRFGMEDGRMKTLQEIGELMGVSRERIRQIEKYAFRKMKNKKRTKNLQQYAVA